MNLQGYQTTSPIVIEIMTTMPLIDVKRQAMANFARLHLDFPIDVQSEEMALELRDYLYVKPEAHNVETEYAAKLISFVKYAKTVYFANEPSSLWQNILSGKSSLHRWSNYK